MCVCAGEGVGSIPSLLRNMPPRRAIKALCAGGQREKAAIGPQMTTGVGGGSVEVSVNGRAIREKIKKPSDLFVGDNCAAQQEGQYLDSSIIT